MKTNEVFNFYEACKYGKSHTLPYSISSSHASKPFELVYSDLWGQAPGYVLRWVSLLCAFS